MQFTAEMVSPFCQKPLALENGSEQDHYCTTQHRTVVEEERKKNGALGACSLENFSESRTPKNAPLGHFLKLLS